MDIERQQQSLTYPNVYPLWLHSVVHLYQISKSIFFFHLDTFKINIKVHQLQVTFYIVPNFARSQRIHILLLSKKFTAPHTWLPHCPPQQGNAMSLSPSFWIPFSSSQAMPCMLFQVSSSLWMFQQEKVIDFGDIARLTFFSAFSCPFLWKWMDPEQSCLSLSTDRDGFPDSFRSVLLAW